MNDASELHHWVHLSDFFWNICPYWCKNINQIWVHMHKDIAVKGRTVGVSPDWPQHICDPLNNLPKSDNNQIFMVVWIGSLSVWLVVILFTTVMKVEENDLTLKVTGGSQQAVDVVRRTVSQGERQQLLPGLQVSVSFALAEQTAHIPGQTVAWREETAGRGGVTWGQRGSNRSVRQFIW